MLIENEFFVSNKLLAGIFFKIHTRTGTADSYSYEFCIQKAAQTTQLANRKTLKTRKTFENILLLQNPALKTYPACIWLHNRLP